MILAHSEPYTRSSFDMGYVGDRAAFVRDLTWAAVEARWYYSVVCKSSVCVSKIFPRQISQLARQKQKRATSSRDLAWAAVEAWWRGGLVVE